MANRVEGLSPEELLDCFLSGLKDHIRRDMIAQDPKSLIHAGMAWLDTLRPHLADYSSAIIKFYLDEKFITLTGDTSLSPAQAQFYHFKRLSTTNAIVKAYTLHCFSMKSRLDDPLQVPDSVHYDLANILHGFTFCKIHEKYRSLHRIKSKASRILSGPNEGARLCWTL
nr:hypothetical protein [Tanacetum cinerariifolium]